MKVLLDAFPDGAKKQDEKRCGPRLPVNLAMSDYDRLCRDIEDPDFCGDAPEETRTAKQSCGMNGRSHKLWWIMRIGMLLMESTHAARLKKLQQ